jgi:hypothetical protein
MHIYCLIVAINHANGSMVTFEKVLEPTPLANILTYVG